MSDTASVTELDGQHVELLPARTVLSMFTTGVLDGGTANNGADSTGGPSVTVLGIPVVPGNSNATGAPGAPANG